MHCFVLCRVPQFVTLMFSDIHFYNFPWWCIKHSPFENNIQIEKEATMTFLQRKLFVAAFWNIDLKNSIVLLYSLFNWRWWTRNWAVRTENGRLIEPRLNHFVTSDRDHFRKFYFLLQISYSHTNTWMGRCWRQKEVKIRYHTYFIEIWPHLEYRMEE